MFGRTENFDPKVSSIMLSREVNKLMELMRGVTELSGGISSPIHPGVYTENVNGREIRRITLAEDTPDGRYVVSISDIERGGPLSLFGRRQATMRVDFYPIIAEPLNRWGYRTYDTGITSRNRRSTLRRAQGMVLRATAPREHAQ